MDSDLGNIMGLEACWGKTEFGVSENVWVGVRMSYSLTEVNN